MADRQPTQPKAELPLSVIKQGRSERILVVEDNADLRPLVVQLLVDLGYQVHAVENAATALKLLDASEKFDLLFTDIGIPDGMNGYELAAAAQQKQPWLKVLFTTGDTKAQSDEPARILRKPYRRRELAEKVSAALDS